MADAAFDAFTRRLTTEGAAKQVDVILRQIVMQHNTSYRISLLGADTF